MNTATINLMLGDFVDWCRLWIKQNILCLHHSYVYKHNTGAGWEECSKCGRQKNWCRYL